VWAVDGMLNGSREVGDSNSSARKHFSFRINPIWRQLLWLIFRVWMKVLILIWLNNIVVLFVIVVVVFVSAMALRGLGAPGFPPFLASI